MKGRKKQAVQVDAVKKKSIWTNWRLYVMCLPAVVYLLLFNYKPMYGIIIAFKNYSMRKGIMGSPWIGFANFQRLFSSYWFPIILKNTLTLSLLSLVLRFPIPIILALALNEVQHSRFRKGFQTISYAPHFISTVVMCGMLTLYLSPSSGIINKFIEILGGDSKNPLLFVLSASFSDPKAVAGGEMLLFPVRPTLDGYRYLLQYKEIWIGYVNTLFYVFVGTILNLAATLPCAYAVSRRDLKGQKYLMLFFMITMYFSGGMIPGYLNVKSLGLLNTRSVVLVNGLVSTFNLIVARTYFMTAIPWEILTKSTFAKTAMANGKSFSAEEMMALIKQADTANMLKYGGIVISALPMLLIYPFLQKYFEQGIMIGSVKG